MIRLKLGGYVDENNKVMTQQELDEWIVKIQEKNEDLKERINKYWKECDRFEAENARLREALEIISKIRNTKHKNGPWTIAREALKQIKTCDHPYDGNMCMNAKPSDKCPDCGMNGYND